MHGQLYGQLHGHHSNAFLLQQQIAKYLDIELITLVKEVPDCILTFGVVQQQQFDVACCQVRRNKPLVELVNGLQIPETSQRNQND